MDEVASLLNHTCAAPLRVVGKERYKISFGVCYRLKVFLKAVIWSSKSFRQSNDSNCGRQNYNGRGHSKIFIVKGESVLLTISSKFLFVFSLIVFLSLFISFLMFLRRSEFILFEEFGCWESSLLWLSSSLFQLVLTLVGERFSSYCSCNLIPWFCLMSSSTLAVNV